MNSEFEWDPVKAASNQKKHSVSVVEAAPFSLILYQLQSLIRRIRSMRNVLSLPACRISVVRSLLCT